MSGSCPIARSSPCSGKRASKGSAASSSGPACLVLITASFWWYGWQTDRLVYQQNRNTGRLLMDQVLLTKHWAAEEQHNKQYLQLVNHDDRESEQAGVQGRVHRAARQRGHAADAGAARRRAGNSRRLSQRKAAKAGRRRQPGIRRAAPYRGGAVRILPADPRRRRLVPDDLPHGAAGRVGHRRHRHGNVAHRPGLEHPPGQGRHHGHRQGDHPHPRHAAQASARTAHSSSPRRSSPSFSRWSPPTRSSAT